MSPCAAVPMQSEFEKIFPGAPGLCNQLCARAYVIEPA